jgi:hypothetical protein
VTDATGNALNGEWSNGADSFPTGDATPGGDFRFQLNVAPGDADGSGTVNVTDLGVLATNFNMSPRRPREGDFNGDARVDVSDLGVLATNFNKSLPPHNPSVGARRPVPVSHLRLPRRPASVFHLASPVGGVNEDTERLHRARRR